MDEMKRAGREVETEMKKGIRDLDGHDLGDDLGNAGDEIKKNVGNLGDDLHRGAHEVGSGTMFVGLTDATPLIAPPGLAQGFREPGCLRL